MITAERLEELIEQGATIYYIGKRYNGFYYCTNLIKIDLKEFGCKWVDYENNKLVLEYPAITEDLEIHNHPFHTVNRKICLEYLYEENDIETKRAMWGQKTHATRTDRFEPPMWEDLPIKWDFYFVKDKYMFHFGYENYNGDKRVIVSKCEYACEYGSDGYHVIYEKFGNATKENYIKACEIVRDLFNKGGVK